MDLLSTLTDYRDDSQDLLFHYTSLTSACKILESNKLKLSSLPNTNDPLEFISPGIFSFSCWGDLDENKMIHELFESRNKRNNYVRFLCFCRNLMWTEDSAAQQISDNFLFKGWARSRMWAQYADNHSGICLVFDKNELRKQFNNLQNPHIKILKDRNIEYSNCLTNYRAIMSDIRPYSDDLTNFFLDDKRLDCLFFKCEDFQDEMEYRFCLINRDLKTPEEPMFVNYGNSLKAIIYGQRFNNNLRIQVPQNIQEFKIQWLFGMPRLV